ncbi:MAG TPA: lactonase family protein [Vicinamibacteria bacterium]|nr:lactonase family protein [Vicinamibacteria bacterium]
MLRALLASSMVLAAGAAASSRSPAAAAPRGFVYFGTYTGAKSRGIYVAPFDAVNGRVGAPRLAAETENPSFLAPHPSRPLLYAVNEVESFEGQRAGSVTAFAVDAATGDLRTLGRATSRGAHPCHLVVDRSGSHVLVANYGGGSVASLPLQPDGGVAAPSSFVQHRGASADPKRQTAPHAHMVATDATNQFALVADLGLDQVLVYRFDAGRGDLQPGDPPFASLEPGSGPRHFAFSPDGRDLYVANEMRVTVTAFRYARGRLTEYQTVSSLPAGTQPGAGDSGAEIQVHPTGRFVYASNRGPDNIAVFARDAATGRLALIEHVPTGGRTPRSFSIDPTGRWLLAANQRSDLVVVFRIDPRTGRLHPTGQTIEVGAPVCVTFFAERRSP